MNNDKNTTRNHNKGNTKGGIISTDTNPLKDFESVWTYNLKMF